MSLPLSSSALSHVLSLPNLRKLAGETSFARGRIYCANGHVQAVVVRGNTLTATVTGTHDYSVTLTAEKGGLVHRCSCPVGADGAFCKHGVAVALAWLDASKNGKSGSDSEDSEATPLVSLDDLRPWLLQQPPDMLADFLLEAAVRDDRLREKLLRGAARATSKGLDLAAYRKSLDRATRTGGFIDYGGAYGFAEGVREAVAPLRELLTESPEHAEAVIALTEHALARVEKALGEADDSDGEISGVLSELQELHLDACEVGRPDPEALAARLFAWEMRDGWDTFYGAVETYADVLGPAGVATYRRLAEAVWQKLPALNAGAREDYSSQRFRVTSIMETLARTTGDLEAVVAIKAKNLSLAYHYLEIAELYRNARQPDVALDWAERGLKAFPRDTDARLLAFLAEEYHRRDRHDDALALIWRVFEAHASLENYQLLKKHAERAGATAWTPWRERALTFLREKPKGTGRRGSQFEPWIAAAKHSTLVEIFLWEKDVDTAWREAHAGRCSQDLWLELAAAREKTHPADALPVYLRMAESCIARTNNSGYEEGVRLLSKAKKLFLELDRSAEWDVALARLRVAHKAKRNFIALAARL